MGTRLHIDKKKATDNLERFLKKINLQKFRPHFKTHQSIAIGQWFLSRQISKITVSSIEMAVYFSKQWSDILIAFPINLLAIDKLNAIENNVKISILVDQGTPILKLDSLLKRNTDVFLKIDAGYGRAGFDYDDLSLIEDTIQQINSSKNLTCKGFLAHFGNTYKAKGKQEITEIYQLQKDRLLNLRSQMAALLPHCIISIGDTPSCSVLDKFEDIDELRPGNFIFYDLMQEQIGSCTLKDIAVYVDCPIVAIHIKKKQIVIQGGAIHFSKESILIDDRTIYGRWANEEHAIYLSSISQEHGILDFSQHPELLLKFSVGDSLSIWPVHSCLTADILGHYFDEDGNQLDHFKTNNHEA